MNDTPDESTLDETMTDPESATAPESTIDPEADDATSTRASSRRRGMIAGAIAGGLGFAAAAGILALRGDADEDKFCDAVVALQPVAEQLDDEGGPAAGLRAYADGLDDVADHAPDEQVADAAEVLAGLYAELADAVDDDATTSAGDSLAANRLVENSGELDAATQVLRDATAVCSDSSIPPPETQGSQP